MHEGFKLEMDWHGQFRIVAPDGQAGEWAKYTSLAHLLWKGAHYVAGTEYGLLPQAETVYCFTPCKTVWTPEVDRGCKCSACWCVRTEKATLNNNG